MYKGGEDFFENKGGEEMRAVVSHLLPVLLHGTRTGLKQQQQQQEIGFYSTMMEVEKPWEFKEEVNIMEEEEEDDAGALHTRTRERKNKAGDDHGNGEPNSFNNAEAAVAQGEEDEKKQSVFFDSTNASSSSETTAEGEAGPKLIATIGESVNSLANRSVALDISNRTMNKIQVHEIEVEKDENETNSKVNIEEYDLEKILDEQETHDLYCPNCKSCITRRVILRKRKRTVKQALRDDPPKKTQISEPSGDASNQMDVERDDQDAPEVFRCLSCFTFFIPTGCSFNIFRIFERRDMNQQVQVQHPSASYHSDNCGSWLLSCFQTIDSPRKTADADSAKEPLLSGSQSTGDKSLSAEDSTASTHINATNEKTEQSKIQLPAGSSSMAQTQTTSVTVNASSSTTITISSSPNKTVDIFVLGIANLIGGLPIIFHNIADLRNLGDANENDEQVGHYWLQLGRRSKYQLHMIIALLSYILFGLLPPVIYGFSFRKSDNRENKMMVVAAASLACVALLAIGKAHVKRPRTYFTTLLYYLSIGLCGSGLSYVAGVLITRLLAHFGLIDQGGSAPSATPAPPGLLLPDAMGTAATAWASY
ncbi:hypothetical protein PR202_gb18228 [Eleusine coracana subsp. coracana]|uniref:Membrane protein of ER body-like protein n=1 Tax=Eleusine coracana subsp. coracana TaxID=191504 RepID=A0AAV5F4Y7_ELECO|nr:hypothetical protein PR202_gb18228 [Eleusine coracana subsp. coracana]